MRTEGFDICEGDKAKRLSGLGKDAYAWLHDHKGLKLCQNGHRAGGLAVENTHRRGFEAFLEQGGV